MAVDMVCERKDGLCNLCGADLHEDCPLIDLAPELAEWGNTSTHIIINEPGVIVDNTGDCESCQ